MRKKVIYFALSLTAAAVLAGCGSSSTSYESAAPEAAYDSKTANNADIYDDSGEAAYSSDGDTYAAGDGESESSADNDKSESTTDVEKTVLESDKIVYTADISLSSKEFDKALAQIKSAADKYGAIVQSENYYEGDTSWYTDGQDYRNGGSRSYSVSLRVPSKNYNAMLDSTGSMNAVVDSKNSTAENISQQYSDMQAEIKSLEAELVQLNGIMQQATRVQDVMDIQERITEVQTQLNQDRSDIDRMDTDVAYSYVNITLNEVSVYVEKPDSAEATFGEKLVKNFLQSLSEFAEFCRNLVIFLVRNWIKLIIFALIIILVIRFRKSYRKKHPKTEKVPKNVINPQQYEAYQGKPGFIVNQEPAADKDEKTESGQEDKK